MQALPRAVLGCCVTLAAAGPVLIAIDDEQWLDPASARVLAFALCRLHEEAIVVILARRPEPEGTLSDGASGDASRRSDIETVPLEPLPAGDDQGRSSRRGSNRTIPRPLLRRIHQGAGGNPLYALAIALELEARHASGDRAGDLPVPRTLSDAIELRLGHLDPRASAAMLAIAALSQPTLAMLQAAIPEFTLSDLESAERSGGDRDFGRPRSLHPSAPRLDPLREHAQLRSGESCTATRHGDRRRRGASAARRARRGGARSRDRQTCSRRPRRVAARRGATESAAQLLEDAARLTPIDQEITRSERIVAAAEHRFSSGEVSRARGMLEEVLPDLDGGPLRARARVTLASAPVTSHGWGSSCSRRPSRTRARMTACAARSSPSSRPWRQTSACSRSPERMPSRH